MNNNGGKLITLPDKAKGIRDFIPGPPLEQILGRKPTVFEMELINQNKQLRAQMATFKVVKIFDPESVDANNKYQCFNLLIQADMPLAARIEAVAKKTNSPVEQVIAFLVKRGIEIMEQVPSTLPRKFRLLKATARNKAGDVFEIGSDGLYLVPTQVPTDIFTLEDILRSPDDFEEIKGNPLEPVN